MISNEFIIELGDLHGELITVINQIQEQIGYSLSLKEEFDVLTFLKYMDVKLVDVSGDIIEQIIDYSKVVYQLLKQEIIILVNIQSYLKEQEIQELLKHSAYEKSIFYL